MMSGKIASFAFFGFFFVGGCAMIPSGEDCNRSNFPTYFDCYSSKRAMKSSTYDDLISYGRMIADSVMSRKMTSEEAFILFDKRRMDVQEQMTEAQSRALANAMRRSSADPK